MRLSLAAFLLLVSTFLSSCGNRHATEEESEIVEMQVARSEAAPSEEGSYDLAQPAKPEEGAFEKSEDGNNAPVSAESSLTENKKKIIKDGEISVKTHNVVSGKIKIDSLVKKYNAYYETEELYNSDSKISYDLKVRIPSKDFERLINDIESGEDEIIKKVINARDVTEEFIDIETRLKNKRDYLKRYRELLAKAMSVKDILEIENNIRVLEEEIESTEGRLKFLNDKIAYSTLNIDLYKLKDFVYKPKQRDSFFERVKESLGGGWILLIDIVVTVISLWPVALIIVVIVVLTKRYLKRRKQKSN